MASRYGAGIQTVVLDNEGEFASLREAVDMLLFAPMASCNPRRACFLSRKMPIICSSLNLLRSICPSREGDGRYLIARGFRGCRPAEPGVS